MGILAGKGEDGFVNAGRDPPLPKRILDIELTDEGAQDC
jgi:hypothetical protein